MKIMVEIDGQMMPLADCHWVLLDPDGCTFGSLRGDTALNAEQAHREFTHLQRHRDKQTREGWQVRLVTGDEWKTQAHACFLSLCRHGKEAAS